jgi:XTP/dITP diphosphohydrolase
VLLLATHNRHKLVEIGALLAGVGWEVRGLAESGINQAPEEDADSFAGNALIKALAAHRATGLVTAADDSGLMVDALGGAPGVYSSRYAGAGGDYAANNAKLLSELRGVPEGGRTARFVTSVALLWGPRPPRGVLEHPQHFVDGELHGVAFTGTMEGSIGFDGRGDHGFGYDPLFRVAGDVRHLAELSLHEKNAISHRGQAFRALADFLRGLAPVLVLALLAPLLLTASPGCERSDVAPAGVVQEAFAAPVPAAPQGHPWPDRARERFLSLDGEWEYAADPEDLGQAAGWFNLSAPQVFTRTIRVPYPPEAPLAFVDAAHPAGGAEPAPPSEVHWYRRHLERPEGWAGGALAAVFLGADWTATVWLNGQQVGLHEGGFLPFAVDLTPAWREGDNLLTVRVEDRGASRPSQLVGLQGQGPYGRMSGLWRGVYLEHRGACWSGPLEVAPRLAEGRVEVAFGVQGTSSAADRWQVAVARPGGGLDLVAGELGTTPPRASVELDQPRSWSPGDPHLYRGAVRLLRGGQVVDQQLFSFGLREVSAGWCPGGSPQELGWPPPEDAGPDDPPPVAPFQCLQLNGQPVYLRALTYDAYDGQALASCAEGRCAADLARVRDLGFNAVRLRGTTLPPADLALADRLGLLVLAEVPGLAPDAPSPRATGGDTVLELVLPELLGLARTHPSVVAWSLFHEQAGLRDPPFWLDAGLKDFVAATVHLARQAAPEVLIEDNTAGGWSAAYGVLPHVDTDLQGYIAPPGDAATLGAWLDQLDRNVFPGSAWSFVGADVQAGQPLLAAELGCLRSGQPQGDVSGCLPEVLNLARRHGRLAGFTLATLADVGGQRNGLLREDRASKEFGLGESGMDLADLLGEDFVVIDAPLLRESGGSQPLTVPLAVASGRSADRTGWTLAADAGFDTCTADGAPLHDQLWAQAWPVPPTAVGITPVHELAFTLGARPGVTTLRVRLLDPDGVVRAANRMRVVVPGACEGVRAGERPPDAVLPFSYPGMANWEGGFTTAWDGSVPTGFGGGETQWWVAHHLTAAQVERYSLVFEAASAPPAPTGPPPQTGGEPWPSQAFCQLNRGTAREFTTPDAPADARGVLSGLYHPDLGWAYGTLIRLDFTPDDLGESTYPGQVQITCGVPRGTSTSNGLRLFDARSGRYPLQPALLVWRKGR